MLFVTVICFDPLVSPMAVSGKAELAGGVVKMNRLATPVPLSEKVSVPAAALVDGEGAGVAAGGGRGCSRTLTVQACSVGEVGRLQLSLALDRARRR